MGFNIQFDNSEFVPSMGGRLAPFEGPVELSCTNIDASKKSSTGNHLFVFDFVIQDSDAHGVRISNRIPVTGSDKNGKPNSDMLKRVMYSAFSGFAASKEEALTKVNELMGQEIDSDALIEQLTEPAYFGYVKARSFKGDDGELVWISDVRLISKQEHDKLKELSGGKRKSLPDAAQAYLDGRNKPVSGNTESTETVVTDEASGINTGDAMGLV